MLIIEFLVFGAALVAVSLSIYLKLPLSALERGAQHGRYHGLGT